MKEERDSKLSLKQRKWQEIGREISIPDRFGELPDKLVNRLDLVYWNGNDEGLFYDIAGVDTGGFSPKDLVIFALMDLQSDLKDFVLTPIFSFKKRPEGKYIEHLKCTRYKGFFPSLDGSVLNLRDDAWNSSVDVDKDGEASSYVANACYPSSADVIMLDNPLKFDPKKRIMYVRSPNGNVKFSNALEREVLAEDSSGKRSSKYELVYEKLEELIKNKSFVIRGEFGLLWKYNWHIADNVMEARTYSKLFDVKRKC